MSHSTDRRTALAPPVAGVKPAVGMPRVVIIAAVAANGVIGTQGTMPWRLPDDLRRFKALTLGHAVIMGRRTWDALGRALPGRENIVITRQPGFNAPGGRVAGSLEQALAACTGQPRAYVIGGGEIYAQALELTDELELTEIDAAFEGDAYFPAFDRARWREVARETRTQENGPAYAFVRYERTGNPTA